MTLAIESWGDGALARLGALAADPSLQPEFELLLGAGLAARMGDGFVREECRVLATLDGADAGFGYAAIVPTSTGTFASIRIGVPARARRRGVGARLLAEVTERARRSAPEIGELELAAYVPDPAAEGFARSHGYAPRRIYWLMERAALPLPESAWPAGVTARPFDGGDADCEGVAACFNRAWRDHDHPVVTTVPDLRRRIASGDVDPAATFLALRDGEIVGIVRGARHETRHEIAVLAVVPEERGRGLGRALLRRGCAHLRERGAGAITLAVDGQNEKALALYRAEGFEVIRTRQFWSRPPA